ncbi:unnamed protein product, partial [marine sediment metagenome]
CGAGRYNKSGWAGDREGVFTGKAKKWELAGKTYMDFPASCSRF